MLYTTQMCLLSVVEIHNWYCPLLSLQHCPGFLANIKALAIVLCTLPVTYCTAERPFSGLRCIKTALMSSDCLSNLTLLHIHPDVPVSIEEVIDEFSRHHPRCLQVSDPSISL